MKLQYTKGKTNGRYRIAGVIIALLLSFAALLQPGTVLAADGGLDISFGVGGKVRTDFGGLPDQALAVAIDSQNRIVTVGYTNTASLGQNLDFALTRYTATGSLDTSFGTGGKVVTALSNGDDLATSLAFDSQGKLIVAGYASPNGELGFAVARYNTDGSLDTTFGTGGAVITNLSAGATDFPHAVSVDASGRIVAVGQAYNGADDDFALVRYNADGSLDTTFGSSGIVTTALGSVNEQASSMGIDAQGKIVAAGYSNQGTLMSEDNDFAVVRYNTDGTLDGSFGSGGIVTTDIEDADVAQAMTFDAQGKIVLAGNTSAPSLGIFALARYNTNGTLDTSFGSGGTVETTFGLSDGALAVKIDSNGKIVAAGTTFDGTTADFAVARYTSSGVLDTSFGVGGKAITGFGSDNSMALSVAIDSTNRVIAAGKAGDVPNDDFALVRYGGTQSCTIIGTPGNDTLQGTNGNDIICGGKGNDTINGRGGNDSILGEDGDDVLLGGSGNDQLLGGNGADTLDGQAGADILDGGADSPDSCDGGSGTDTAVNCELTTRVP